MENMTLQRIDYPETLTTWPTPRGRTAEMLIRANTSDWNTVNSIMGMHDEYGLKPLSLTGRALDVGAHIGAWTIAAAMDNPELHVIAIEAIEENADLVRRNAELNGVADRVTVVNAAAAAPGVKTADVFWRAQGNENAEHHAFIGNSSLVYDHGDPNHETATMACVSLDKYAFEQNVSIMKIDCEGCEWGFLTSPNLKDVDFIIGEWHPTGGHTSADIVAILEPTHAVRITGPEGGPGGFVARRKPSDA